MTKSVLLDASSAKHRM